MLKVLEASPQHYVNQELQDIQAGFRKGRVTRDRNANIHQIIEKSREPPQKKTYFCFSDCTKSCVDLSLSLSLSLSHTHTHGILKEMGIPDHFTCLLKNLCAGQEATVRNLHEKMD